MNLTEKTITEYNIWRTFHFNLCEVLQLDPDKATTQKALELAAMQLGVINGLIEGLACHAEEQGYPNIDEFYKGSYQKSDYIA